MENTVLSFSINSEFICYILLENNDLQQVKSFLDCWYEQQYIKNDVCLSEYLEKNCIKLKYSTNINDLIENSNYTLEHHNY